MCVRDTTVDVIILLKKGELEDFTPRLLWQSHNQSSSAVRRVRESRRVGTKNNIHERSRSDELATRVIVEKETFE